ncbi:heavy metal-associated domain-containing protein [Methylocapsa sp. D3K7]|uniref:heavy-metal-associated domain-containing protein n=1 Tax=Methylocapsa sp. D3K7 TaxID=3041435 RepID=UPI00244EEFBE|nr:heavy metal-associated domain-containing protein [Methylocapsa sp. D3K7]WGJ15835.1 heavy metal-associated domain-containing protein [Methylocapsa sp. D3K7]
MGKVSGVQHVKADYPTETLAVIFDPALTNVGDICAAIAQKGYRCTLPADAKVPRNNFKKHGAVVLGILGVVFVIFLDTKWISQNGAPDVS